MLLLHVLIFICLSSQRCSCADDSAEHVAAFGGTRDHEGECLATERHWVWEVAAFPPSSSCGQLYFQKQVYFDAQLKVTDFLSKF